MPNPRARGISLIVAIVLIGALIASYFNIYPAVNKPARTFVLVCVVCIGYLLIMRAWDESHRAQIERKVIENTERLEDEHQG